ncbi:MAG: Lrp/AsnC family transcriptional regulator [Acidimicrobiaceae bacterium]|nr:Lrp/AsnC family transcriptional regulator [Acidimicrobiaceae bacterium]MDE0515256.1 Lrp/AsnC family transcriptional regulator [Acidimicrobiaceae bacterium]MDE0655813.1 Lrp/AsnC family transcriptional regulator [Acidimicrobiaceae bacterium]MXZ96673.1 Lrp/AsnC family transcriptional regulator [Acidimicrobiaceae bacterium]MYF42715.1 Lrp/AsnC family transcriptional regulator [Acidimicrobiaceae bacterium]
MPETRDTRIPLDDTDRRLIGILCRKPRISVSEMARLTGLARGTVRDRIRRLEDRRVIFGYGPDVDPRAAGLDVCAFTTLTIAQGAHQQALWELTAIDEVLEIYTVTGRDDLLLRIVAATNDDLHEILQRIAAIDAVRRTETLLALHSVLLRNVANLVATGHQP